MTPSRNTQYRSMTCKQSLAILPAKSPNSSSLPKSEFDHLRSKIQTMNDNIHSQIQTMTDSLTDRITAILQNLQMEVPRQTSTTKKSHRYHPNSHIMKTISKN